MAVIKTVDVSMRSLIAISFLIAASCKNGQAVNTQLGNYFEIHESATSGLPIAVQFEELFPARTDHFITHLPLNRNTGKDELKWSSLAFFGGRYSLQMEIQVIVDYENKKVTRSGAAVFGLREYTDIEDKGGALSSSSTRGVVFGEAEWNKLYASHGDFSVIGVNIKNDAPLPGFEKLVSAARRPLVPVSLLRAKR